MKVTEFEWTEQTSPSLPRKAEYHMHCTVRYIYMLSLWFLFEDFWHYNTWFFNFSSSYLPSLSPPLSFNPIMFRMLLLFSLFCLSCVNVCIWLTWEIIRLVYLPSASSIYVCILSSPVSLPWGRHLPRSYIHLFGFSLFRWDILHTLPSFGYGRVDSATEAIYRGLVAPLLLRS